MEINPVNSAKTQVEQIKETQSQNSSKPQFILKKGQIQLLPTVQYENILNKTIFRLEQQDEGPWELKVGIQCLRSTEALQKSIRVNVVKRMEKIVDKYRMCKVKFSPDGKMFATIDSTYDGKKFNGACCIKFWDPNTGDMIADIEAHEKSINDLCFTSDSKILVTCSGDNSIKVWDVENKMEIGNLVGHTNFIFGVDISPDDTLVASASGDKTVKIWDLKNKKLIQSCEGHLGQICALCYSLDGQFLVSCGFGVPQIIVWETQTMKKIKTISEHASGVEKVEFSKDGTRLLSCSQDKTIKIWSVPEFQCLGFLTGHTSTVTQGIFAFNDRIIFTSSNDNTIRMWDIKKFQQIGQSLIGHYGQIWGLSISPNDTTLVSTSVVDSKIIIWELTENIYQDQGYFINQDGYDQDQQQREFQINLNDEIQIEYSQENLVHILNSTTQQQLFILKIIDRISADMKLYPNELLRIASSGKNVKLIISQDKFPLDDRQNLINYNQTQENILYELNKMQLQELPTFLQKISIYRSKFKIEQSSQGPWELKVGVQQIGQEQDLIKINVIKKLEKSVEKYRMCRVKFAPNSKFFATVDSTYDGKKFNGSCCIKFWDPKSGNMISDIQAHEKSINDLCFTSDGKILVTCSGDNQIRIWDVESRKEIGRLVGHTNFIFGVVISPDDKVIASASGDKTVRIWDLKYRKSIKSCEGHLGQICGVCYSPDGKILVSCGFGQTQIVFWETQNMKIIKILSEHASGVERVQFSKDGRKLLSCSQDKTIKIWSVSEFQCLGVLTGHTSTVTQGIFAFNDRVVISSSNDNTIRLWDLKKFVQIGQTLTGHHGQIWGLSLAPDESTLVSVSVIDSKIMVWELSDLIHLDQGYFVNQLGVDSYQQTKDFQIHPGDNIQIEYSSENEIEIINLTKQQKVSTYLKQYPNNSLRSAVIGSNITIF